MRHHTMSRVLVAVFAVLVVVGAGCRTSGKDETDTQRSEHRTGEQDSLASISEPARAWR
jgi:hypothetical protein